MWPLSRASLLSGRAAPAGAPRPRFVAREGKREGTRREASPAPRASRDRAMLAAAAARARARADTHMRAARAGKGSAVARQGDRPAAEGGGRRVARPGQRRAERRAPKRWAASCSPAPHRSPQALAPRMGCLAPIRRGAASASAAHGVACRAPRGVPRAGPTRIPATGASSSVARMAPSPVRRRQPSASSWAATTHTSPALGLAAFAPQTDRRMAPPAATPTSSVGMATTRASARRRCGRARRQSARASRPRTCRRRSATARSGTTRAGIPAPTRSASVAARASGGVRARPRLLPADPRASDSCAARARTATWCAAASGAPPPPASGAAPSSHLPSAPRLNHRAERPAPCRWIVVPTGTRSVPATALRGPASNRRRCMRRSAR